MMRRVRVMRCAAISYPPETATAATKWDKRASHRSSPGTPSAKASLGMNREIRPLRNASLAHRVAGRGRAPRRERRGGARPARRRARGRRDARNAGDENHAFAATELATPARDELIDPATRVSFGRGTRRTAYGDVLDR